MLTSYENQVCIVTGASSGIGAAFAERLAVRGARLALFARREDKLRAVAASLPGEALIVVGDVTSPDDRARLLETVLMQWGRVDVLINNAGRGDGAERFVMSNPALLDNVMHTNYISAVQLTYAVLPAMLERKNGLIINVSSPMGDIAMKGRALYSSTKAALSRFSRVLYREVSASGVHVLDLKPGYTRSEMVPEERDSKLPPLMTVKPADVVAEAALVAGLAGKPSLMTGGLPTHLAMFMDRNFPRLLDRALTRVEVPK